MLLAIAFLCVVAALILLFVLSYIDLKEGLLPNELVLGLAATGLVFHLCTLFHYLSLEHMAIGAFIGGGILYVIRGAANLYYKDDTLGLGDVKLLCAGGLWLGTDHILLALTLGALVGFLHGMAVALYTFRNARVRMDLSRFSVPAGPGFAVGIVAIGAYMIRDFPAMLLNATGF